MKLARNYNCNTHRDASRLRDLGGQQLPQPQAADPNLLSLVRATRTLSISDEEEQLLEQLWTSASSPGAREEVRNTVCVEGGDTCTSALHF